MHQKPVTVAVTPQMVLPRVPVNSPPSPPSSLWSWASFSLQPKPSVDNPSSVTPASSSTSSLASCKLTPSTVTARTASVTCDSIGLDDVFLKPALTQTLSGGSSSFEGGGSGGMGVNFKVAVSFIKLQWLRFPGSWLTC